jgi:hypothetical protein
LALVTTACRRGLAEAKHLTLRHTVASQLVCDDHPRLGLQSPEQLLEEALGGFRIAPFLNQDVQRNTILINSAPEIVLHALDPNEDLVQVPLVARSWSAAAQAVGKVLAEFPAPAPDRLVGDGYASFSQYQLDVTQAQAEDVIQPDGVADDLGGEPMAGFYLRRIIACNQDSR